MPDSGEQRPSGPPDYKVYRSRKGLFSRLRSADLSGLRDRAKLPGKRPGKDREPRAEAPLPRPPAAASSEFSNGSGSPLWDGSCSASSPSRSPPNCSRSSSPAKRRTPCTATRCCCRAPRRSSSSAPTPARPTPRSRARPHSQKCFEQQATATPPTTAAKPGEFRADTLMLIRAGGGAFRKLSIPRDSYAEIPGQTPQKINAAYAFGGAALQIKTIEEFLDIQIDHVAIVDFTGFEDLIDAVGGVEVDLPHKLCADIAGGSGGGQGGITLRLKQGREHPRRRKSPRLLAHPRAQRMPRPRQERLHPRLQRLRPREGPAGRHQRDQGPPHRPPARPLQLHQGPDHRLGRAESLRQRHGLPDDAAAGPLRRDRRQRPRRRPLRHSQGRLQRTAPKAASKSRSRSGARPSTASSTASSR